jgi:multidrug resistance protein, MATE family
VMLLGGIGIAVQTVVAQAYGGRRYTRASQAVWIALWGILATAPLFIAVGFGGRWMLRPFGLDTGIEQLAADFWLPRVGGAFLGVATWAALGFFNGIGRTRVTLFVTAVMAVSNAVFNQIFIFEWHLGVAGSGWATTVAQALGFATSLAIFLSHGYRRRYRTHLTWKLHGERLVRQFRLGLPMGLLWAADLIGISIFQIMQVKLGPVDGAATQIAMMLTGVAYLPGVGIAMAGTTLVGQSIGAGDRRWAMRLGTRTIMLTAAYMGGAGLLLALAGPWIVPLFTGAHDMYSAQVATLGAQILWLAAIYQLFDGLNLGSGFALRGAGDAVIPAVLVIVLSWVIFVPLAHAFTFAPDQGWVQVLPQAGWGVLGGWSAIVIYVMLLGLTLYARWRSGAWQRISI